MIVTKISLLAIVCIGLLSECQVKCAHIVFFHNLSSYSHRYVSYPLAVALAEKGHQVTIISPHKLREPAHPKINEIVPKSFEKTIDTFINAEFDVSFRAQKLLPRLVYALFPTAVATCEDLLTSPEIKTFLNTTKTVDLLILDNCMTECAITIAYKYRAKHAFLHTVPYFPHEFDYFGITPESSSIPESEMEPPQVPMSFLERVFNTLVSIHFRFKHYQYLKQVDEVIRKHGDVGDMPFVDDVVRNASLVMYSGDILSDYPRSQPPMVVNVAGIHCKNSTKPLPEAMEKFIHSSKQGQNNDGFVYISMGSLVKPSNFPDGIKNVFFDAIRAFPQIQFLWKWNGDAPANMPDNLFLAEWFPQADILAHPKIRTFITQGGRPSTIESLYNGVPMITFPVLGDQDANSLRMNYMGGNILFEIGTVTADELKSALNKTVYDPGMNNRLKELQKIILDRQVEPLDNAVWWVEYTLRHKDTSHLRPAGFHQTWYQRRLIDVWAFIFTLLLVSLLTLVKLALVVKKVIGNLFLYNDKTKAE